MDVVRSAQLKLSINLTLAQLGAGTVLYDLMRLIFDWDGDKARQNRSKHKVSFEEAKTIFNDPFLITFPDDYHSSDEERFLSIGVSADNRTLLVVHSEHSEKGDEIVVRIISARRATSDERKIYEEQ